MVDLRGQLHSPAHQYQRCVQLLQDPTWQAGTSAVRSVDRKSERTPLQKQRRLEVREVEALIDHYRSGATINFLAQQYRIHRTTVYEHLDRQGVPRRQRGPTPEQVRLAAKLYEGGLSLARIGEQVGIDAQTVRRYLADAGIEIRKRRGW